MRPGPLSRPQEVGPGHSRSTEALRVVWGTQGLPNSQLYGRRSRYQAQRGPGGCSAPPPSSCKRQGGLGSQAPQPRVYLGKFWRIPLSKPPPFPWQPQCSFQEHSPPEVRTDLSWRGVGGPRDWGGGRLLPNCLLGPVWDLGSPSRSLAEPTAPALINGPQPAGGAGQRIRAEKGNYSRPAALGFPQARLKCHISDAAPRSACLLREPGPGGRKPTRKCIGD